MRSFSGGTSTQMVWNIFQPVILGYLGGCKWSKCSKNLPRFQEIRRSPVEVGSLSHLQGFFQNIPGGFPSIWIFVTAFFAKKRKGWFIKEIILLSRFEMICFVRIFVHIHIYIYIYVYHNIYNSQTKKNGWPPLQKRRISFFGAPFVFGEKIWIS